jgi:hypothetical protein
MTAVLLFTNVNTHMRTHVYVLTYIHTYIRTYIHTHTTLKYNIRNPKLLLK